MYTLDNETSKLSNSKTLWGMFNLIEARNAHTYMYTIFIGDENLAVHFSVTDMLSTESN